MFVVAGPPQSGRSTSAIERLLADPDTILLVSNPAIGRNLRPKHISERDWMARIVTPETLKDALRGRTCRIVIDDADNLLAALLGIHPSRIEGLVIQTEGGTRVEIDGARLRIEATSTKFEDEYQQ